MAGVILGDAGILEFTNFVDLPSDNTTDKKGRIAFITSTGKMYRDNGTTWVEEHVAPLLGSVAIADLNFDPFTQAEADAKFHGTTGHTHAGTAGNGPNLGTGVITGLAEFCRDTLGAALVAGSRVTITVDDAGDTITISSDDASTAEFVRDTIGTALVAGTGATITVNDAGDTITIAATGSYSDEQARDAIGAALVAGTGIGIVVDDPGDHITISSTITQYTDEMVDDRVAALLIAGTNITLTYNDAGNSLTIAATGGGGSALTVEEVDGSPTDAAITKIVFPNGSLGIAAHVATYTPQNTGLPVGLTGAIAATRYVGGVATVAPTTGTFAVGDFVISQAGSMFICTVAGSPGTWVAGGGSLTNPMTTAGDVILGGTAGAPARLPKGSDGTVLTIDPTTHLPVWSAAGGGGGLVPIQQISLAADAATFDFTGIVGTYDDLVLAFSGRATDATTAIAVGLRFNGDSGANYDQEEFRGQAGTISSFEGINGTSATLGAIPAASATAAMPGNIEAVITGYARTTFHKAVLAENTFRVGTGTGNIQRRSYGGAWRNTAAITQITLVNTNGGNFLAGSVCTLYGRKAGTGGVGSSGVLELGYVESTDTTTRTNNSLTLVDVNALTLTITCTGTPITFELQIPISLSSAAATRHDFALYDVTAGAVVAYAVVNPQQNDSVFRYTFRITPLGTGTRTYKIQTKMHDSSGTALSYRAFGTSPIVPYSLRAVGVSTAGNKVAKLTPPVLSDWAWANQGDATAVDTPVGISMAAPVNASSQLRMLVRALPATPYKITVKVSGILLRQNYEALGIALRDSSSGKVVNLVVSQGPLVLAQKYSGPTGGFVANYALPTLDSTFNWFQIEDDGTTRYYRISADGVSWRSLYSVGRTDYATPDQFVLLLQPANAGVGSAATFEHYSTLTTPLYVP